MILNKWKINLKKKEKNSDFIINLKSNVQYHLKTEL